MMRLFLFLAALNGFIAVALGAFGAHGLEGTISDEAMSIWAKAVQSQMLHTVALLAAGFLCMKVKRRTLNWAGWLFFIGIILFSGSLYTYALTDITFFALITPFGGVSFLIGWALLGYTVLKIQQMLDGE